MKHLGTKVIKTERLVLRPFRLEDAPAMYENWAKDPAVTKYLTWKPYKSISDAEKTLTDWTESYAAPNFYQWAICLKEDDVPIGSISVVEPVDDQIQSACIGYCIGKNWWSQGLTSEALQAVIDFLFSQVQLKRIEAYHNADNPASGKVMQKCGMHCAGMARQARADNTGVYDAVFYELLKR